MSNENMLACLTVNSPFSDWVSSLWPATIPIFHDFGLWLNVIEDPWDRLM